MKFVQGEENSQWSSSTLGWGKSDSLAKLDGSARLENLLSHNPRVAWSAATSSNYLKETTGQVKSTPIQWALHTFVRQQSNLVCSQCVMRDWGLARWEGAGEKRSGGLEEGAELWLQLRSAGSPQGPQQNPHHVWENITFSSLGNWLLFIPLEERLGSASCCSSCDMKELNQYQKLRLQSTFGSAWKWTALLTGNTKQFS